MKNVQKLILKKRFVFSPSFSLQRLSTLAAFLVVFKPFSVILPQM